MQGVRRMEVALPHGVCGGDMADGAMHTSAFQKRTEGGLWK